MTTGMSLLGEKLNVQIILALFLLSISASIVSSRKLCTEYYNSVENLPFFSCSMYKPPAIRARTYAWHHGVKRRITSKYGDANVLSLVACKICA